jgi:ribose transport system substrate-binding protein
MKIRSTVIPVVAVAAVAVLAGCSSSAQASGGSSSSASSAANQKIGFSFMTLNNVYFDPMNAGAKAEAKKLGVDYVSVDANLNVDTQITGIENLIAQGAKGLIINPVDSDAIVPAVQAANQAGIPVITADVDANGGKVISHVGSDNEAAGKMAGEYVAKHLKKGDKVGIVDGTPISSFQERAAGFAAAMKAAGITIEAHPHATANTAEAFTAATEDLITANPDIKYVYTVNDTAAGAANTAIENSGRKDVFVATTDGEPDVVKLIQEGKSAIKVDVGQQPGAMGRLAISTMHDYLDGKKVPKNIAAPLTLVTQANAASFHW